MPFVDISLARGKSDSYLEGVSDAVHQALVAELNMQPRDHFQLIHQLDLREMVFPREFRGGPRSDDWIRFVITDGVHRGEDAKRAFYKTLVRLLAEGPGVRPEDVFVMMVVSEAEDFSFADGVIGADVVAAETIAAAAQAPGTEKSYSRSQMAYAITHYFRANDRGPLVSMLPADFVLKVPTTLPYGGEFVGPEAFDAFVKRVTEGADYWESFVTDIDRVIEADDHLIAPITITATAKDVGTMVVENLWLFTVADGNLRRAQIYADTAAAAGIVNSTS
jgi:ketosteroid isomerase-like protein